MVRRLALSVALAASVVAVLSSSIAARPASHSAVADDQFVVGTVQYPDGTRGTSFAFHVRGAKGDLIAYGLTKRVVLQGPMGWNHNKPLVTKCIQIRHEYFDTCDDWADVKPVPGQYTATGLHGSKWTATIHMAPVVPPQAVTARLTKAGLSVSWRRGTSTGAYYVDVEDARGNVLVDVLVPGGVRKHVFAHPRLKKGVRYYVIVNAYPTNITKNLPLSTKWTIAGASFALRGK